MNIEIIKKLGEGVQGTVYLVKSSNKKYIYKIEKYKPGEPDDAYSRQVEFDKFANEHPDKFMTLKSHGIIENCDHIQPIPKWAQGKFKKSLEDKNKSTTCFYLMYSPIYKYTLGHMSKVYNSSKLYLSMLEQILEQVHLMHKAGYYHNDIHPGNIMSNGKYFHIIDYGLISNKKWQQNKFDERAGAYGDVDAMAILWNVAIDDPVMKYIQENNIKLPKYNTFINKLSKTEEWATTLKYMPKGINKKLKTDLRAFTMCVLYYDIYKKCLGFTNVDLQHNPKFPELLLYMVKHVNDYPAIIKKIKTLKV